MGAVGYIGRDLHIVIGCPSTECGEGVVLAKPGSIGGVAPVPRKAGVKTEKRHGARCLEEVVGWWCLSVGRADI